MNETPPAETITANPETAASPAAQAPASGTTPPATVPVPVPVPAPGVPVVDKTTSQVTANVVNGADEWRKAYIQAFDAKRTAVFNAVATERVSAIAEFARLLPQNPGRGPNVPAKPGGPSTPGAPGAKSSMVDFSSQLTRMLETVVAEHIVASLREIIVGEVRRQVAAALAASLPAPVNGQGGNHRQPARDSW